MHIPVWQQNCRSKLVEPLREKWTGSEVSRLFSLKLQFQIESWGDPQYVKQIKSRVALVEDGGWGSGYQHGNFYNACNQNNWKDHWSSLRPYFADQYTRAWRGWHHCLRVNSSWGSKMGLNLGSCPNNCFPNTSYLWPISEYTTLTHTKSIKDLFSS